MKFKGELGGKCSCGWLCGKVLEADTITMFKWHLDGYLDRTNAKGHQPIAGKWNLDGWLGCSDPVLVLRNAMICVQHLQIFDSL